MSAIIEKNKFLMGVLLLAGILGISQIPARQSAGSPTNNDDQLLTAFKLALADEFSTQTTAVTQVAQQHTEALARIETQLETIGASQTELLARLNATVAADTETDAPENNGENTEGNTATAADTAVSAGGSPVQSLPSSVPPRAPAPAALSLPVQYYYYTQTTPRAYFSRKARRAACVNGICPQ